ncbi:MAG: hypothetical protein WD275_00595, partial [Rhodothermales bacterium]
MKPLTGMDVLATIIHHDIPQDEPRDMMGNRYRTILVAALLILAGSRTTAAQSYINQTAIESLLLQNRVESVDDLPEVFYNYYILDDGRDNTVLARNTFYKIIGRGDINLGQDRGKLVELLNRRLLQNLEIGDTLVVP